MNFYDIPYRYYDEFAKFIKENGYKTDGIRRCPTQCLEEKISNDYFKLKAKYDKDWNKELPSFICTNMPEDKFNKFKNEFKNQI